MKFKKLGSALLAVTMIFSSSALITANAKAAYPQGDVNFDGMVTHDDIAMLQNYLFGD